MIVLTTAENVVLRSILHDRKTRSDEIGRAVLGPDLPSKDAIRRVGGILGGLRRRGLISSVSRSLRGNGDGWAVEWYATLDGRAAIADAHETGEAGAHKVLVQSRRVGAMARLAELAAAPSVGMLLPYQRRFLDGVDTTWGPVPPSVRDAVTSLGLTTMWSVRDWYDTMEVAVHRTVEKWRQEGLDAPRCAVLREHLFAHLGSLPSPQLDSVATFAASSGLGLGVAVTLFEETLKYVDPWPRRHGGGSSTVQRIWAMSCLRSEVSIDDQTLREIEAATDLRDDARCRAIQARVDTTPSMPNPFAAADEPSSLTGFCWRTVGVG